MDPVPVRVEELLRHAGWLRGLAHSLVGEAALADDIVQDTWVAALERPPQHGGNPRGWLARTVTNFARQRGRRESERPSRESASRPERAPRTPEELVEHVETERALAAEVLKLEEPYRSTLLRHYHEDLTSAEIARIEGIPDGTVRWRLKRGLELLRARLDTQSGRKKWLPALAALAVERRFELVSTTASAAGTGAALSLTAKLAAVALVAAALVAAVPFVWPAGSPRIRATGEATRLVSDSPTATPVAPAEPELAPPVEQANARQEVGVDPGTHVTVTGRVVNLPDPDVGGPTTPAANVAISARMTWNWDESFELDGETDATGAFHLEGDAPKRPSGLLRFSIAEDGVYRQASHSVDLAEPGATKGVMVERVVHGTLRGKVRDDDGHLVQGALVRIGVLEVPADEHGAFEIEHYRTTLAIGTETLGLGYSLTIGAEKPGFPGFISIQPRVPISRARGGWDEMVLTLTPVGALALQVIDGAGAPIAGVTVAVALSKTEPEARWESFDEDANTLRAVTDADGRIEHPRIWAGKRLSVTIQRGEVHLASERRTGARLLLDAAQDGTTIEVGAGTTLALVATLPEPFFVRGLVRHTDGRPVERPWVRIADVQACDGAEYQRVVSIEGDAEGRFEHELRRPTAPCELSITAADGPGDPWANAGYQNAAERVLHIGPGANDEEPFVVLELQPMLAITGVVLDAKGAPVLGDVRCFPSGEYFSSSPLTSRQADLDEHGRFVLAGLAPGVYDLEVRERRHVVFTMWLVTQRFPGIAAGTQDVELRLADDSLVRVHIEARAAEGEVGSMNVLLGKLDPRDPAAVRHVPDRETHFDSNPGWPINAPLNFGGQARNSDAHGLWDFWVYGTQGAAHDFREVSPGWYWIAARAFATNAKGADVPYHPVGTGIVYLEPGDYRFTFDLHPTRLLQGKIENPGSPTGLWLALYDGSEPVSLRRGNARLDTLLPIGANGRFVIDDAPFGGFTLRIGTESELRAGRFQHAQPLEITASEPAGLAITLP